MPTTPSQRLFLCRRCLSNSKCMLTNHTTGYHKRSIHRRGLNSSDAARLCNWALELGSNRPWAGWSLSPHQRVATRVFQDPGYRMSNPSIIARKRSMSSPCVEHWTILAVASGLVAEGELWAWFTDFLERCRFPLIRDEPSFEDEQRSLWLLETTRTEWKISLFKLPPADHTSRCLQIRLQRLFAHCNVLLLIRK